MSLSEKSDNRELYNHNRIKFKQILKMLSFILVKSVYEFLFIIFNLYSLKSDYTIIYVLNRHQRDRLFILRLFWFLVSEKYLGSLLSSVFFLCVIKSLTFV